MNLWAPLYLLLFVCVAYASGCREALGPWTTTQLQATDGGGRTLLHQAARSGDHRRVMALVGQGADIRARDRYDWTPLHYAAAANKPRVIRALAEQNAELEARAWYDMTPLHWAALRGSAEAVATLVELGAQLDATNIYKMTPLHEAATGKVAAQLLAAGAPLEARNDRGMTALHLARVQGVAEELLKAGASIAALSNSGLRPVQMAVVRRTQEPRLMLYPLAPTARLRGETGSLHLLLRNESLSRLQDLELSGHSPACSIRADPQIIATLPPGRRQLLTLQMTGSEGVAPGRHPLHVELRRVDGTPLLKMAFTVDTSSENTPEDRGMVRVGTVVVRPRPQRWHYLAFTAPIVVLLFIFVLRRRRDGTSA